MVGGFKELEKLKLVFLLTNIMFFQISLNHQLDYGVGVTFFLVFQQWWVM